VTALYQPKLTQTLLPCAKRGGGGAPQSGVTEGASYQSSFRRRYNRFSRIAPSVTAFGRATSPVSLRETGEESIGDALVVVWAGLISRHGHPEQVRGRRKKIGAEK